MGATTGVEVVRECERPGKRFQATSSDGRGCPRDVTALEWQYLQRIVQGVGALMELIESDLRKYFFFVLFGG